MDLSRPILSFKIKPDPDRTYFFRVEVYESIRALRLAPHPVTGETRGHSRMLAACFAYRRECNGGVRVRVSPELGVLRFARRRLDVGIVSHEVFHATMRLLARIGKRLPDDNHSDTPERWVSDLEEMACRAQQNMATQIYTRLYSAGIIKQNRTEARKRLGAL